MVSIVKTLIEKVLDNETTKEMDLVANDEKISLGNLRKGISNGTIIIPKSNIRKFEKPIGIGEGLRTKVNANIGTSPDHCDISIEIEKLKKALEAKTDTVMDLSIGGDLGKIRKKIIENCPVPIGTVPIYQAAVESANTRKGIVEMDADLLFDSIKQHAMDGVDFITVHCGVTLRTIDKLKRSGRVMGIVSRGGSFLTTWMAHNKKENPLFEEYDRLLDIAGKYDTTLSLGDGLRPGCLEDANDSAQLEETRILADLATRAKNKGVQVMIEGPGHVPLNKIKENMEFQKQVCNGAPYYVLGPLVTDIAPGYDHITSAIGGAIAAWTGANFLCYVTPSEHLSLPTPDDVFEGVISSRIAGHAADIAKGLEGSDKWDLALSQQRYKRDWDKQISMSIDPKKAKKFRKSSMPDSEDVCTMCGEYCAIKQVEDILSAGKKNKKTTDDACYN